MTCKKIFLSISEVRPTGRANLC